MISPKPASRRQRVSASIACMACRRLKMKCIGAEKPPCQRCARSGRECLVGSKNAVPNPLQFSTRDSGHSPTVSSWPRDTIPAREQYMTSDNTDSMPLSGLDNCQQAPRSAIDQSLEMTQPSHEHPASTPRLTTNRADSPLPSVYSVVPFDLVEPSPSFSGNVPIVTPSSTSNSMLQTGQLSRPINDQHIFELIVFFNERLLHNLPFLTDETTCDIAKLMRDKHPLAYCAAFVAARFVPGYKKFQQEMIPEIIKILDMRYCSRETSREQIQTILQAFCVLYGYTLSSSVATRATNESQSGQLSHWSLKSTVEMYASRWELYRTAEVLRASLKAGRQVDDKSPEVRQYILWLWIFTISHYTSMMFRAPPTIIADSNIKTAASLLQPLDLASCYLRIVAEVELCLLWHHSITNDEVASEWWCTPLTPTRFEDTVRTLDRVEVALQAWRDRWLQQSALSESIVFHYRFTRFCVSTYVTRLAYHRHETYPDGGNNAKSNLTPPIIRMVLCSVQAAADFCTALPALSPLQRDRARYIADAGFSMVAFSCFYIIRAAEKLSSKAISLDEHVRSVEAVANMMIEMGIDTNHGASIYGRSILEKLAASQQRTAIVAMEQDSILREQGRSRAHSATTETEQQARIAPAAYQETDPPNLGDHNDQGFSSSAWSVLDQGHQFEFDNWFLDADIEASADVTSTFMESWSAQ